MEETGEGCGFFCSPKLPYLSTMSQQFCLRLSESQKWPYIRKKINSSHFFTLGCKIPGGFLFAMFDIVMPVLEQLLESGDFLIFSAWHFVSRLTCLDILWCGASCMISYSLLYQNNNNGIIVLKQALSNWRTKWKGQKMKFCFLGSKDCSYNL